MMRSCLPSLQYDSPRPDSCRGAFVARGPVSFSLWTQRICPVPASSDTTDRLLPPVENRRPRTTSGVDWRLYSGDGPRLSVLNRHATSSELKFEALIWSSGA